MFYRSAVAICTLSFTSLFVTGKPLAATSPYSQLSTQFSRDFQQQLKKTTSQVVLLSLSKAAKY